MRVSITFSACVFIIGSMLSINVFASDGQALELLDGVSEKHMEILTETEAGVTRGERIKVARPRISRCGWRPCVKWKTYTRTRKIGEYKGRSIFVKH